MTEIRLAVRRLMSRRAAMAVSVATLAIAIGAGAATWSLLSAVLLNPLPVQDAKRLAVIGTVHNTGPGGAARSGVIYPYYPHVAANGVFESISAVWLSAVPLPVGSQKAPEATPVMFVSAGFFECLALPFHSVVAFRRTKTSGALPRWRSFRIAIGEQPSAPIQMFWGNP